MKLTFLGTGTSHSIPVVTCNCAVCCSANPCDCRLRTSALLEDNDGHNLLFDIGPDFRQQMLRHKVGHIDAILVTHAHRDHVAGIDDIRPFNYVQQQKMQVYLNSLAQSILQRDYHYIFGPHDYPGLPEADLHVVEPYVAFEAAGNKVMPIALMHKDMPVLGYRIGGVAYITDASFIPEQSMEHLHGLKVLVINALRKEKHWSHFCLDEALSVIERLRPERAFITHISHEMGLHADVQHTLPHNVFLAHDNLTVKID